MSIMDLFLLPWTVTVFILQYAWSLLLWVAFVIGSHYLLVTYGGGLTLWSRLKAFKPLGKNSKDVDIDEYYK